MDRDAATVLDIVMACRGMARHVDAKVLEDLARDDQLRDAVIRKLEIIGEATKRLSPAFREAHATVSWQSIAGMRDRLIHAYDDIDLHKVWEAATVEAPKLMAYLEPLLPRNE